MTDTEKRTAERVRAEGYTYGMISKTLGISLSTVKSHIRRRAAKEPQIEVVRKTSANTVILCLSDSEQSTQPPPAAGIYCKRCGAPLVNTPGHRQKSFCSKSCQERYWREHRNITLCASLISCTCSGCGKEILDYKGHHRKYCSHQCCIRVRCGGAFSLENKVYFLRMYRVKLMIADHKTCQSAKKISII